MDSSRAESAWRGFRRWQEGLSLLDFMLALAGVMVVSVLAIPGFFGRPEITLDRAALLLASDLRFAQNEAALSQRPTEVWFDPLGDGYELLYEGGELVDNPVGGGPLVRRYSRDAIFRGVRVTVEEQPGKVRFDASGFALDRLAVLLEYEGEGRRLHLTRGSGMMEIEGLAREWRDDGL
jgi:Tfp pilus assembly protein FimT